MTASMSVARAALVRTAAVIPLALIAVALASMIALTTPRIAHACSAGPDYNPAAQSELIVAGYITDLEILGRTGVMTYLRVQMTFEVDQYLLGSGPTSLDVFDVKSAVPPRHLIPNSRAFEELDLGTLAIDDLEYDGSGGGCGPLNADPRGRYWIAGLSRQPDTGQLVMHGPTTFAIGSGPADPAVLAGIERVRTLLVDAGLTPAPSPTGNAGLARVHNESPSSTAIAGGTLLVAVLLVATRRWISRTGR
jgi:hypothetical protein